MHKYLKEVIDGEEYAVLNPEYEQHVLEKKYELYLKQSGIPEYYWNVEFSDYKGVKSEEEFQKVMKFSERCWEPEFNHTHLYLWGQNSCQKTALGVNVLKAQIRKGKKVKFILAGTLISLLMKEQGFSYHKDVQDKIEKLTDADIILIDDVFCDKKSLTWKSENNTIIVSAWDEFLRSHVSSSTRLILTSNIAPSSIKEYWGEAIYELIDRNFFTFQFLDNIKNQRKATFKDLL